MYCVLLPYLLTRCMLFNGITELKDLFIINKNNFTFQSFLYNGLCEKAFSADIVDKCYTEDKGFKDGRIELLKKQVKRSTEDSSTHLLYNGHTTFQEIFLQYLNSEINYIQYMQQDYKIEDDDYKIKDRKAKATNMKGGFIYRYAIMMSNMSDPEYRKHLKEYFEKCLDSYICDEYVTTETEKQFFKKNFKFLLSRFNKLFLGNAVCNYSVVSTSHEHRYIDDEKYLQHLLNNYARLQGVPIEEDQCFSPEQEKLIISAPIDQATIAKLSDNNEIIFNFNEGNSQLVQKMNNSKHVSFICTFETQNDTKTNPEIHYVAAQMFEDKKGTITLLRTGQPNEKIDNNFKDFIKKAFNKKEDDINIVNVHNQLSEQHNDVNMDGLLALTAIRNGGILDMQRENKPSWVDYVREKKEQEKSQQKTNLHEK